jgi:hypothetical protein
MNSVKLVLDGGSGIQSFSRISSGLRISPQPGREDELTG